MDEGREAVARVRADLFGVGEFAGLKAQGIEADGDGVANDLGVSEKAGHDVGGDRRAVLGAGDAGAFEDVIAEGALAVVLAGDVGHAEG